MTPVDESSAQPKRSSILGPSIQRIFIPAVISGSLLFHLGLIGLVLFFDPARKSPPMSVVEIPIDLVNESEAQKAGVKGGAGQGGGNQGEAGSNAPPAEQKQAPGGAAHPEATANSEPAKQEQAKSEPAKSEPAKSEPAKPEPAKPAENKPAENTAADNKSLDKPAQNTQTRPESKATQDAAQKELAQKETAQKASAQKDAAQQEKAQRDAAQKQAAQPQKPGEQKPQAASPPGVEKSQASANQQPQRLPSFLYQPMDNFSRAVPVPPPTEEADAEPISYKVLVFSLLERAKEYPETARNRRARGHVILSFSIDDEGRPQDISLIRSSGQPDLDTESLAMVSRAAPFPVPPAGAQRIFAVDIGFGVP